MSIDKDLQQMAGMASAGQAAAMAILLAEMRALSSLIPGLHALPVDRAFAEAGDHGPGAEADVEAAFDNMPV